VTPLPFPRLIVVTDRRLCEEAGRTLLDTIERTVGAAEVAILYREKDLDEVDRLHLGRGIAAALPEGRLVVAGDHLLAAQLGAVAVHLAADQPTPAVPPGMLVGRSCHSADEVLSRSATLDYATLSPVATSISKPGYGPEVGDEEVAKACASGVPVWALGGITPGGARRWFDSGAAGVAVCGAVMAAPDPAAIVSELAREIP
jgi:thiamine-phosphate pyrophosphorylase